MRGQQNWASNMIMGLVHCEICQSLANSMLSSEHDLTGSEKVSTFSFCDDGNTPTVPCQQWPDTSTESGHLYESSAFVMTITHPQRPDI
jgi:hypothetical protein